MEVVDVCCNVIRFQRLNEPYDWAEGDFTKVFSDGSEQNATYREHLRFLGFPEDYINKQPDAPTL